MENGSAFTTDELQRYARHFALPDFGYEAQKKLRQSAVLVVGAGGLGAPLLLYLAAAGIGRIGILDFDTVSLSNLQRQVLYTSEELGQPKAVLAARRLRQLNPHVEVYPHTEALSQHNALDLFRSYDLVVDGTDNFPTRYLANDAAVLTGKPYIYGSIYRYEGQVSVFNALLPNGERSINYRNLYPQPPHPDAVPNCAEGGVLGVLPGIIGSMQANEAIKILAGIGRPLIQQLFLFDAATAQARTIQLPPQKPVAVRELIDYQAFCTPAGLNDAVAEIHPKDLQQLMSSPTPPLLIDVREPYERAAGHLGGRHIPVGRIRQAAELIREAPQVVLYCRSGLRSAKAVRLLQEAFGFGHLKSLQGGLQAAERYFSGDDLP